MERTVTVTAAGHAQVTPDQVVVSMAVEFRAASVGEAVSAASDAASRLVEVLEEAGVTEADRQTLGLNVQEHYGSNGPDGHVASYRLQAVVRDLSAAGTLVQAAADEAGDALRVHGFAFAVADPLPGRARARRTAVEASLQQARELAQALGSDIGDLVELREGNPDTAASLVSLSARPGMPVEAGALDSTVVVTGTWRLAET